MSERPPKLATKIPEEPFSGCFNAYHNDLAILLALFSSAAQLLGFAEPFLSIGRSAALGADKCGLRDDFLQLVDMHTEFGLRPIAKLFLDFLPLA